ncbi:MAG TPA: hypothetical protein VMW56_00970 [Candidatus Margulisiibacteriota bacterium]|nr:hypothetical protein [Candidatus Margulisiibacteriota bacterium]
MVWSEGAYEVTVTLKVPSDDLEDVVARTFADPHCVDIRVQSTPRFEKPVSPWRET